jgi:uncharacterized membrane protein YidH (DUF202 family)
MEFPDDENGEDAADERKSAGKERGGLPWYWTAVALVFLILAVLYSTGTL